MTRSAKSKTTKSDYEGGELEPLILDGISQILDNGKNMPRDYKKKPLEHDEQVFIIETLFKELQDPDIHKGLIYLYGHILDYIKETISYN